MTYRWYRDPEILLAPIRWPDKWRKLFVLTLPVSGPLWFAGLLVFLMGCAVAAIVLLPIVAIVELWRGESR